MNQDNVAGKPIFTLQHQQSISSAGMKQFILAVIVALNLFPALHAQDDHDRKYFCGYKWDKAENLALTNQSYRKKLWDGYEISLGPARNSQGDESVQCTAAIYNRAGSVVYRTTGFNVEFDEEHTGWDFDGDGKPEVVFHTDTGGGNRCCWAYNVISLSPKPHKLFEIDEAGAVDFKKDSRGVMIWQHLPGPYGYTSMANNPFAAEVFRVRDGKLVDATPEFCSWIFSDKNEDYTEWAGALTPDSIKALQATGSEDTNNEGAVSGLLSRALQHVFCRQFDAAMSDLNLWPEASRKKMKADFAESIKDKYPDFARQLLNAAP